MNLYLARHINDRGWEGTVIGADGDDAWVKWDADGRGIVLLTTLTRIGGEPEEGES